MKKSLLFIFTMFIGIAMFSQECSDLFISEYVEGTGNNKALELYNPTNQPIDLGLYNLVRYSNGGFVPAAVGLAGTLAPKTTYVVVLDKRDPNGTGLEQPVDTALALKADTFLCPVYDVNKMMYFNGNDAVTLEKKTGEIIDIFGIIGGGMTSDDNGWGNLNDTTITYNSGGNPTEYTIVNYIVGPLFWLSWSENQTLLRKSDISGGVTVNPDPAFIIETEWDSIPVNTFDSLGFHNCYCTYLSVGENSFTSQISVYPNPVVNGEFSIETEENIEEVELLDISGKLVDYRKFEGRNPQVKISIGENLKGFYLVNIKLSSGEQQTKKLLFK